MNVIPYLLTRFNGSRSITIIERIPNKIQFKPSLLDNAPNYLVRYVIQKRNNKSVWDFKLHFVDN